MWTIKKVSEVTYVKNRINGLMVKYPTQLAVHGQWWSIASTQLLHVLQWWTPSTFMQPHFWHSKGFLGFGTLARAQASRCFGSAHFRLFALSLSYCGFLKSSHFNFPGLVGGLAALWDHFAIPTKKINKQYLKPKVASFQGYTPNLKK